MAKAYIDTVKYLIHANVEIEGMVEKPDVVGAIFGQTEGLLGDELDLRELQKNGRIGRIEVDIQLRAGKSVGKILLPSSLDMIETSILAAALETVERVGPCDAKVTISKIEDTRNVKRKVVIERAKNLLKTLLREEIPESKELSEVVREEVKIAEIEEYGPEKLPSGPNIQNYESIVLVEGRADILNLLKNDMNNVIAIGGANISNSITKLCREKEVTVFLDGDRGGDIILKELLQVADIDYVARAPPGKEVEELTRKEIIKCIRNRVPVEQIETGAKRVEREEIKFEKIPAPLDIPQVLKESLDELENTLRARIYDEGLNVKNEVPVRDIIKVLSEGGDVYAVVLDGVITQRLVDIVESKNGKLLLGIKTGNVFRKPEGIIIFAKKTNFD